SELSQTREAGARVTPRPVLDTAIIRRVAIPPVGALAEHARPDAGASTCRGKSRNTSSRVHWSTAQPCGCEQGNNMEEQAETRTSKTAATLLPAVLAMLLAPIGIVVTEVVAQVTGGSGKPRVLVSPDAVS